MRKLILLPLLTLLLAVLASAAFAQATPPSAFGQSPASAPIGSPPGAFDAKKAATPGKAASPAPSPASPPAAFGPSAATSQATGPQAIVPQAAALHAGGLFGAVLSWVVDTQQRWQRSLADGVRALHDGNPLIAGLSLAGLSFAYGVLHAIGPGHGKTIISAYVTANEEAAKRGILICFLAAAVQALSAVILVAVLAVMLNATGIQLKAWSEKMETVSYALIALFGIWLFVRQVMRLIPRTPQLHGHAEEPVAHSLGAAAPAPHLHEHEHGHEHEHEHEHHHPDHAPGHDHADHHDHGPDCGCGHSHMPDLDKLKRPLNMRELVMVVLSVGVRPCSGAIVVLVFALIQGLFWAGVAATFAMAFGTALTVAAIAIFTLSFRELALSLGGRRGAWANAVWTVCGLGGAAVITLFGTLLFVASLGPARPF